MQWFDKRLSQHRNLCSFAFTVAQVAEQTIFAHINDRTTPEQFQAALQSLRALCQRLESQMDWSHYAAAQGLHSCIWDVFTDAEFRLQNLAIMQQTPLPEPSRQQVVTVEGVVIDLEERLRTSREETYLGTDDAPPPNR
jgi:hypothetical protein